MDCDRSVTDHDLLLRIDERVLGIHSQIPTFVTRKEFAPVKIIVYGLVSIVLTAVLGGIVNLVIIHLK